MKAIMVMYDSLRRDLLESYGCDWTKTPNFKRLADLSVQFENCYVGSMPCMPARRELQEERIASRPFADEKEYFLLNEMFIAIARAMAGENTDIVENRELYEIFLSLRLDMLRNYEKPWTTEDLCRRANLEKSQFFACYQKFFQSTPHADLLSVRLEKAKNLLTNEALPINLAARQCGFSDITHFSRYFKKECGCSPKEYARRWKENCLP